MMGERGFWLTADGESSTAPGSFTSWSCSSSSSNGGSDKNFDDPYALEPLVHWLNDDNPTTATTTTKLRHRNHPFLLRRSDTRTIVAHPWNRNQHRNITYTQRSDHPNITATDSAGTTVATRWH
jgi:hypothetical protein